MKNITKSLLMITAVAALAIGGTVAYFSDEEISRGNTISTGTIDIDVDNNAFNGVTPYALTDMKPGYTDYINFTINNDGSNPANVWKKLSNMTTVNSNLSAVKGTLAAVAGLDNVIVYDLSVKVYAAEGQDPIWFQTIYTDADGKTLNNVYGSLTEQDKGVLLGMIPSGGHMDVVQSYHMMESAGNEYQGKTMTFDMNLFAEQLTNTVTMVHKTGGAWDDIDQNSTAKATLTYKVKDDQFNYDFSANGLSNSTTYVLLSSHNPWDDGTATNKIGEFTTDGSGNIASTTGSIDLNKDLVNAKVWLVPSTSWTGTQMTNWNGAAYLFETALIDYTDPIK